MSTRVVVVKSALALATGLAFVALAKDAGWSRQTPSDPVETLRLGSEMAARALRSGRGSTCEEGTRCDTLTGCIAPSPPPGTMAKILPKGEEYDRYVRDLQAFQVCRELVLLPRGPTSNVVFARLDSASREAGEFADSVLQLNGDIFWQPASESSNVVTRFGDEARAVFGPIPDGDCGEDTAKTIPLQVEGNVVDLRPNQAKPGRPLEFEHRDVAGKIIKWTDSIARCDKPSLAGNVSYCGLNSRLNRVVKGSVEWLFFCRKSVATPVVRNDPYWQRSDPRFAVFGTIGFNSGSGEIAFFDGRKDRGAFDWSQQFIPPGGRSYSDSAGRAAAADLYDPTFQVPCFGCHDNKNAYAIDPHAEQARVGYFSGTHDPRALVFSLGDYLPEMPRLEGAPFRVIGSGYTSTYGYELFRAKTVRDPTGNCTVCHTLTTLITGRRLAADAVAREPWISTPTSTQASELREEKAKYANVAAHRTGWALRSGIGKIHPWMVPVAGNKLSALSSGISTTDWRKLSDCLWDAGGAECGYRPLYIACPAPEPQGDGSEPAEAFATVLPSPKGEGTIDRIVRVGWRYLNSYGSVPQRDDVRFNVAVKESVIPASRETPNPDDYPTMDEAKGTESDLMYRGIGVSGSAKLMRNASYAGHTRWTEPTPSTIPREFKIDLPGKCNRRYLIRLLPKRFCFDQSNITYSSVDYLLYADVECN